MGIGTKGFKDCKSFKSVTIIPFFKIGRILTFYEIIRFGGYVFVNSMTIQQMVMVLRVGPFVRRQLQWLRR
jgi:hypothetical protein